MDKFYEIEGLFNNMTLRERVIMFAALVLCLSSISHFWVFDPELIRQAKSEKVLQTSIKQGKEIEQEMLNLQAKLKRDPLKEINREILFSKQTLAALDKELEKKLVKFIHAQKMPVALIKVLGKPPGVKINTLTSLPVETFDSSVIDSNAQIENHFYKHTLQIELIGNYNSIYNYLLNLENIPEQFYWYALDYQVTRYPLAKMVLQIYTISDQRDLVSG